MHRRTAPLAVLGLLLLALAAPSVSSRRRLPAEGQRLPQLRRDGGRDPEGRNRPSRHRRRLLDRQELPEPQHLGGQDLRQRGRRRERARGAVRRAPPRPRAPDGRADARDPALVERRLREQRRGHRAGRHARDLDHLHRQPGRRGVRPHRIAVPRTGARTASRTRARPPSAPTSTATTATAGRAAAGHRARSRRDTYHGSKAFSAPESRVVRDFINSRVVGGRQQIKTAITFHTAGQEVLWPYGYTYTDVPSDMTADDHAALVAIGKRMAASNGYTPEAVERAVHHRR